MEIITYFGNGIVLNITWQCILILPSAAKSRPGVVGTNGAPAVVLDITPVR